MGVVSEDDLIARWFTRPVRRAALGVGDDCALLATGFKAWAEVFFLAGRWYAVGGAEKLPARLLGAGERTVCLAQANDWLNDQEVDDAAHKTR